jgi:hypothetical protein
VEFIGVIKSGASSQHINSPPTHLRIYIGLTSACEHLPPKSIISLGGGGKQGERRKKEAAAKAGAADKLTVVILVLMARVSCGCSPLPLIFWHLPFPGKLGCSKKEF